jgi:nitrite reductase (NADH) small subunit
MANWTRVASVTDCPPDTAREFVVRDRIVAVFHVAGQFYAMDGICPHQGGPLGKGQLADARITCPWHGWRLDVRTGRHESNASVCHPTFPVKVQGSDVFVDVHG